MHNPRKELIGYSIGLISPTFYYPYISYVVFVCQVHLFPFIGMDWCLPFVISWPAYIIEMIINAIAAFAWFFQAGAVYECFPSYRRTITGLRHRAPAYLYHSNPCTSLYKAHICGVSDAGFYITSSMICRWSFYNTFQQSRCRFPVSWAYRHHPHAYRNNTLVLTHVFNSLFPEVTQ